jgi:lysophospholipase L1-like esterase
VRAVADGSSRRRRWQRVLLALLSTTLALAGGEFLARRLYGPGFASLVDEYEHHPYRPFVSYLDESQPAIVVHTNSLGWKDSRPGVQVARNPDPKRRVVLLGDSFTEGMGVAADETLGAVAARALGARGLSVEVLNGGRLSYSPLLEYQRLKRFLDHGYRADVLVVLPDVSDVQDELIYAAQYEFAADGEPLHLKTKMYPPLRLWFYNRFALARWVWRAQLSWSGQGAPSASGLPITPVTLSATERGLLPDPRPLEWRDVTPGLATALRSTWPAHPASLSGWARAGMWSMSQNLTRMVHRAKAHNLKTLVVVYPWPTMLYERDDPRRYAELRRRFPRWYAERALVVGDRAASSGEAYRRFLTSWCDAQGVPCLDLFPAFAARADWPRLFLAGDVHWSPEGHRLVGAAIAVRVAELLADRATGQRSVDTAGR